MKPAIKFCICLFLILLTSTWFNYSNLSTLLLQPTSGAEFTYEEETINASAVDLVSSGLDETPPLNEIDVEDCFRSRQRFTPAEVSSLPYINLGLPKMGELFIFKSSAIL
jgi:hypothetical protein